MADHPLYLFPKKVLFEQTDQADSELMPLSNSRRRPAPSSLNLNSEEIDKVIKRRRAGKPKYILPRKLGKKELLVHLSPEETSSETNSKVPASQSADSYKNESFGSLPITILGFRCYLDHEGREIRFQPSLEEIENQLLQVNKDKRSSNLLKELKGKKRISRRDSFSSTSSWTSSSNSERGNSLDCDCSGSGWEAEIMGLKKPESSVWWS